MNEDRAARVAAARAEALAFYGRPLDEAVHSPSTAPYTGENAQRLQVNAERGRAA